MLGMRSRLDVFIFLFLTLLPHWASATFSIVAYDPETGDLGVAVQSKFFGVGSVVPYARADVGAVATQSFANPTYGPVGLALLANGKTAEEALTKMTAADAFASRRQAAIVDAKGRVAAFTGSDCMNVAVHLTNLHVSVQGNILANTNVAPEMLAAFEEAKAEKENDLADCLLAALEAGQAAGGDKRGQQSAALLVVRKNGGYAGLSDRYIDLRVDDHKRPIEELDRLLKLHRKFYRR